MDMVDVQSSLSSLKVQGAQAMATTESIQVLSCQIADLVAVMKDQSWIFFIYSAKISIFNQYRCCYISRLQVVISR